MCLPLWVVWGMLQGESIEEAVVREVAEEAGVAVGAVSVVGSQPWPIGLIASPPFDFLHPACPFLPCPLAAAHWICKERLIGVHPDLLEGQQNPQTQTSCWRDKNCPKP
jgi:8-oxo-dGTP pyrophosphatase MutT (NUDIX family)